MKDWIHPTGQRPDTVIMVMLGHSKSAYDEQLAVSHDYPLRGPGHHEVWTCNAGFRIWDHDLLFVMDDLRNECYKWPNYGEDLMNHDKPIITSAVYPEFSALEYPYRQVCHALGLTGSLRYFLNSLPFMLAYAGAIGVRCIHIYGADYWHPESGAREDQKANAEFHIGFLAARGVDFVLPKNTTLLSMHQKGQIYGYRYNPNIAMDRDAAKKQRDDATIDDLAMKNAAPPHHEPDLIKKLKSAKNDKFIEKANASTDQVRFSDG